MILDHAIVDDLKSLSIPEDPFFDEQILLFTARCAALLDALAAGLAHGDPTRLRTTAHAMAGTAATIGATQLRDLCVTLERRCRDHAIEEAPALLQRINVAFGEAESALREEARRA